MSNEGNRPERYLSWRSEDNSIPKVIYEPDTMKPNAGKFTLSKEDHTLGNLIRLQLLRDPTVRFAGYRMPHPLINDCEIRVETMDSRVTPIKVFETALEDLLQETVEFLDRGWDDAVRDFERRERQGI